MAAALFVAEGGPVETSPELHLLANINKYGADAVMGRPLGHNEIIRMNAAQSVVNAYNERNASKDWARWADDNPGKNKMLVYAMRLLHG